MIDSDMDGDQPQNDGAGGTIKRGVPVDWPSLYSLNSCRSHDDDDDDDQDEQDEIREYQTRVFVVKLCGEVHKNQDRA